MTLVLVEVARNISSAVEKRLDKCLENAIMSNNERGKYVDRKSSIGNLSERAADGVSGLWGTNLKTTLEWLLYSPADAVIVK